jgi:hypothetical protein
MSTTYYSDRKEMFSGQNERGRTWGEDPTEKMNLSIAVIIDDEATSFILKAGESVPQL